jgi:hypothetical protein
MNRFLLKNVILIFRDWIIYLHAGEVIFDAAA